jgi:N-acetylglucosaminyldiphosphoundecaprenol N-acetyl-beta-D-mannosaminyltransferase
MEFCYSLIPKYLSRIVTILGIRFTVGDARSLVSISLEGGLVVVPAAPALVASASDSRWFEALQNADLAIADSGLMVLLWRAMGGEKITRVSGLEYLQTLLVQPALDFSGGIVWVLPSDQARERLLAWLGPSRAPSEAKACYVAPLYGPGSIRDPELLQLVRRLRPAHVVIGLGGGIQEPLGYYLRNAVEYRPGIHCIGAAIGFITGDQVKIPRWADHFYLGWLFRSLSDPRKYLPRYLRAWRLIPLMWRFRDKPPPTKGGS